MIIEGCIMGTAINWSDFCLKAKKLAMAPFSFANFAAFLRLVDPQVFVNSPLLTGLCANLGLCRFRSGRQLLLRDSLHRFVQKNSTSFDEAPQEAINAYNALIDAFFVDSSSMPLKITPKVVSQPIIAPIIEKEVV